MSMSTYVKGFVSEDDATYKKHAKVLIACYEAGINEMPKETAEYFGAKYPDKYLLEEKLEIEIPIHKYNEDCSNVFEVIVSEIPQGVYKIKFVNSY